MKENTLATELTGTALRQLATSYAFKQPRLIQIRKFRALYNNQVQKQLRIRYNVPIPIFSGMIDTLQADLDDSLLLKYHETDPADWKAAVKANAYITKEMESMLPGAKWNQKFRQARQEMLMTGRATIKYVPSSEGGYSAELSVVPFEDFYFEPKGGGQLEKHLFCGQSNIWKTKKDLEDGVKENGYNAEQVKKLTGGAESGTQYKQSDFWTNYDFANRFLSLNLTAESNNYVGEPVYNMVEWVLTYKGERWYLLFEAFSGTWVKFEKWKDMCSSGLYPFISMASHEDLKNFASKGFADDLYPHAVAMTDFFNEDMENRKRRNSNARGYDKDMIPNVAQLDQAQMGRDRLVEMDTKGGTRRLTEGIYTFVTPEITGTIDMLKYMEDMAGRNFGVTDIQQGDQKRQKTVGVTYAELGQVSKRLSFASQPFIELGQELGLRVFGGLKDYLREPLSIKLLGENGYEWDTLKRIDLNIKKDFEISVSSQMKENKMNELAKQNRLNALNAVRVLQGQPNPNVNSRMADEYILRDVGGYSEAEIALLLDPQSHADKRTVAETSAAIQDIMMGRMPPKNYNATAYFLETILDFVKTHQDDPKVARKLNTFLQYIQLHEQIAVENEQRRAKKDASMMAQQNNPANPLGGGGAPNNTQLPQTPQPEQSPQQIGLPQAIPQNG